MCFFIRFVNNFFGSYIRQVFPHKIQNGPLLVTEFPCGANFNGTLTPCENEYCTIVSGTVAPCGSETSSHNITITLNT